MKRYLLILLFLVFVIVSFIGGILVGNQKEKSDTIPTNSIVQKIIDKPLQKYTIDSLSQKEIEKGSLEITQTLNDNDLYTQSIFRYTFKPDFKNEKTTTGLINIPKTIIGCCNKSPILLMFRGYVDPSIYKTGVGTIRASEVYAKNGFITIAPDFLGYADSDKESSDIFEARFQTYVTALSILNSLDQIKQWDGKNIFIWGHSNGGQISLALLEISKRNIPTSLWAPVTEGFPYSILFYTNESDDRGKLIRNRLSDFEKQYDVDEYSITNYFDNIQAPIIVHQGGKDDAIPLEWTNRFVKTLENGNKDIKLYFYNGSDHNLRPDWDNVVKTDLVFFKDRLITN